MIQFSKIWGDWDTRWNYCGGDYNFRTLNAFMEYYGIKEATIIGKDEYICDNDGKTKQCFSYEGFVTKELHGVKKHWVE